MYVGGWVVLSQLKKKLDHQTFTALNPFKVQEFFIHNSCLHYIWMFVCWWVHWLILYCLYHEEIKLSGIAKPANLNFSPGVRKPASTHHRFSARMFASRVQTSCTDPSRSVIHAHSLTPPLSTPWNPLFTLSHLTFCVPFSPNSGTDRPTPIPWTFNISALYGWKT